MPLVPIWGKAVSVSPGSVTMRMDAGGCPGLRGCPELRRQAAGVAEFAGNVRGTKPSGENCTISIDASGVRRPAKVGERLYVVNKRCEAATSTVGSTAAKAGEIAQQIPTWAWIAGAVLLGVVAFKGLE